MLCSGLLVTHLVFAIKKKGEKNILHCWLKTFLIHETVLSVQIRTSDFTF